MNTQECHLKLLPDYLFWDIDKSSLSVTKSKKTIISRVLNYGKLDDWRTLVAMYGLSDIATTAQTLKDLDIKTATFVSHMANIPIDQFRCYTMKQLTPQHWDF
jgi:hypothetical protein